ncbi:excinuclease ABC subunit UvrB, partial [bacterium]|nr:excinuclease ABC subunit UvrB [bacterium]
MSLFQLVSEYAPSGDQPAAIKALADGLKSGRHFQTLQGVTGSGKTFTLANVIAQLDRPVLVLSHNKTLAAQLYSEFKAFFPHNAVEYFISYYDYYLPESYIPQTDTYIAKDASINENIERLRLSATASLIERRDVIVVASVSCIYGLGSPSDYEDMCIELRTGMEMNRDVLLEHLVAIQYTRNDLAPEKAQFRVRGDCVDVFLAQKEEFTRIEFWGDTIESISRCDMTTGKVLAKLRKTFIFPSKLFVMPQEKLEAATSSILAEMKERVKELESQNKLVEAQRLFQRVNYDLEMMREIGYCSGIENYSRHLAGRAPGSRPYCLLDFFQKDFITMIDESHVTIPQVQAMYRADRNRKVTLVEHGFRLPSALDNRPLKFEEFEKLTGDTVYVSATPADYELQKSGGTVIDQIVRPTGLLDPEVEIRPLATQVDDVMEEIRQTAALGGRTIVTTLTKKSAERLADYLSELGMRVKYLHSEIDAIERVRILSELRDGAFDCLIGINLLREGIDLPEVRLVAILDADKEGFLRSERSLIQVAGRAARNADGRVILYADIITDSIKKLLKVTEERRAKQIAYNEAHHITPKTVIKKKRETIEETIFGYDESKEENKTFLTVAEGRARYTAGSGRGKKKAENTKSAPPLSQMDITEIISELEREMMEAAEALEFE